MSLRACYKRTVRRDCFQRHQQLVFVATPAVGRENGLAVVGLTDLDVPRDRGGRRDRRVEDALEDCLPVVDDRHAAQRRL